MNTTVAFQRLLILAASVVISPAFSAAAVDEPVATASCNQYMVPKRSVAGRVVGQEACLMQDVGVADPEKKYHRVNGLIQLVDMNGGGKRETVTDAWRRIGLLKAGEPFNRDKYVGCVESTAAKLKADRFITDKVAERYVQEAKSRRCPLSR